MAHLYWYLRALLGTWLRDERAQDAFEYILIIGAVSVALIAAMVVAPNWMTELVKVVCNGIKGLNTNFSSLTCPA